MEDAGKFPVWNKEFSIMIADQATEQITLDVVDEDSGLFSKDDPIGSVTVKVSDLCALG